MVCSRRFCTAPKAARAADTLPIAASIALIAPGDLKQLCQRNDDGLPVEGPPVVWGVVEIRRLPGLLSVLRLLGVSG
jgi:hypothetical protein